MANICTNDFYAYSETPANLDHIYKFIDEHFDHWIDQDAEYIEGGFDSRWDFPEVLMEEMFQGLPNKDDIYMRCLSYEYGSDYIGYHKCEDKEGWYDAL